MPLVLMGEYVYVGPFLSWEKHGTMEICTTSQCPRCHVKCEDKDHIICCLDPKATGRWIAALESLQKWMSDQPTAPRLAEAIILGLQSWYQGTNFTTHLSFLLEGFSTQTETRWVWVLDGWVVLQWHTELISGQRSGVVGTVFIGPWSC